MSEYDKLTTNQIKSRIYNIRKLIAKFKGSELLIFHYRRQIDVLLDLIESRKGDSYTK